MRRAPARHTGRGGFTLTELVVVIGLVALLAAVAAPRFFGTAAFDARLFADEVATALRYARQVAVATGCPVQVSPAGGGYALHQRSGCDTGAFDLPVDHPGRGGSPYAGAAPSGVSLSFSVAPFWFDAAGRARAGGGASVDVDVQVAGRSLRVTGETGYLEGP